MQASSYNTKQMNPSQSEKELAKARENALRLERVVESLAKVPQETNQMIFQIANNTSELEIIQLFNQEARDLFNILADITRRYNCEKQYKIGGYSMMFEQALKVNHRLPLEKFSLIILEFAAEIYREDEDCFLKMEIPDKEISIDNEFGLIRSEMFKELWLIIDEKDKNVLKERVVELTCRAHTYLYKSLLKQKQ